MIVKAPTGKVCGLIRCDGNIVGECEAECSLQPGCDIEWFENYATRETPEVDAWRRHNQSIELQVKANSMKTSLEYANKRVEAERWQDLRADGHGPELPPKPSRFEHLRAEVDACGCTPDAAADAIMASVVASAQDTVDRVTLREKGRALV